MVNESAVVENGLDAGRRTEEVLKIKVFDHIIIGSSENFISIKEKGLM